MPEATQFHQRTRHAKLLATCFVAWAVLIEISLIAIHRFLLDGAAAWSLAIVPLLPLIAAVAFSLRRTSPAAGQTDDSLRYARITQIVWAAVTLGLTLFSVWVDINVDFSIFFLTAFPAIMGVAFLAIFIAIVVTARKQPPIDDRLMAVRTRIAAPGFRRLFRFLGLMMVYLILNTADFLAHHHASLLLSRTLDALCVLSVLGLVPIYRAYMAEEHDDFQRHLFHQSIVIAGFATLLITTIWGRLELTTSLFHFRAYWTFPLYCYLQYMTHSLVVLIHELQNRAERNLHPTAQAVEGHD